MKQTITVNNQQIKIFTHPNYPIILNKGNNKNPLNMRYVGLTDNIEYLKNMGYIVVSHPEFIETYKEYWDYPIGDIKHDYYMEYANRNDSFWVHLMDAYELIIERYNFIKLCEV